MRVRKQIRYDLLSLVSRCLHDAVLLLCLFGLDSFWFGDTLSVFNLLFEPGV